MRAKCIHCSAINTHTEEDLKQYFLTCKSCGKSYRFAETKPILDDSKGGEMVIDNDVTGNSSLAGRTSRGKRPTSETADLIGMHNSRGASLYKLGKLIDAHREFKKSLNLDSQQPRVVKIVEEIERKLMKQGTDIPI